MASFELKSNACNDHIRALSRAIQLATKLSKDALLEFTTEKMRLCARSDLFLLKFVFNKDFFNEYSCDRRHRCYINTKALLMPFRSMVLLGDKDSFRQDARVICNVEDEINNKMVFKIWSGPCSTTLTYRISINDLASHEMSSLEGINRTIHHWRVEISPKQGKKERFLLSAFNNFAPDMDQVTVRCSASEIRFIGSTGLANPTKTATSEFTHKRDDFHDFNVKEDLNVTFPLRYVKFFLNTVETNKIPLNPKYVFEGIGSPAHFIYENTLCKAHLVSSTCIEFIPDAITNPPRLPIENGPNESFIVEEDNGVVDEEEELRQYVEYDDEETDDDGYNDNESGDEEQDLLDGNLDRLNTSANGNAFAGLDSIRSEMKVFQPDPSKVREIMNIDQDPDDIENVNVIYSSGDDDDDDDE